MQTHNRYMQRLAGTRYELLVADQLRKEGWEVIDTGQQGTNDHGIDLIASKDGVRRYVQCKGWRKDRIIHEDVVSHLYGSVAAVEGPENLQGVEIYLYSPAQLDDFSKQEVINLGMHFVQLDFPSYHSRHSEHYHHRRSHYYHRRHYQAYN